jgi:hypothetical protein
MGRDNETERMEVYSKAILNLLNSGKGKGEVEHDNAFKAR